MRSLLFLLACSQAFAQLPVCSNTPAYSTCDLAFDLEGQENPAEVSIAAEFRSPRHSTYLLHAFSDGGRRMIIRFSPNEAGDWEYRVTSSVARWNDQESKFTAGASDSPGFIHAANVHHFQFDNKKPHLWMSTAIDKFAQIPRSEFDSTLAARKKEGFTHLRVTLDANTDLREAADRVKAINAEGMVTDLVLAAVPKDARERDKYVMDIANRFSAFNLAWMGIPAFEDTNQSRQILKAVYDVIGRYDPYHHPRTSMARMTSAPMSSDGWMDFISYGTVDPNVGAVEHQFYQRPQVNTAIQSRADLWNATMNGQYPGSGSGEYMKAWQQFMADNRYWEFEPYFDVEGGRAVALADTEYVVYLEKPAQVDVTVEKHKYQVFWINPETGAQTKGKDFNAEHFVGEPPDKSHDWVLLLSREGHKEGLASYRFESRQVPVQEIESNPEKIPFSVDTPSGDISPKRPPFYSLHIKRDTKATRNILVEWTGEVTIAGQGYRVMGQGKEGTMRIPTNIVDRLPASLAVRVLILNANGKAYELDSVLGLVE